MTTATRFNKHHVTNGTEKARCFYSLDNRTDGRLCVTIYAKDFASGRALGAMFDGAYKNDTDSQRDHFDEGNVVLFADHPLYAAARVRAEGKADPLPARGNWREWVQANGTAGVVPPSVSYREELEPDLADLYAYRATIRDYTDSKERT